MIFFFTFTNTDIWRFLVLDKHTLMFGLFNDSLNKMFIRSFER
jgi:hypothetical protein